MDSEEVLAGCLTLKTDGLGACRCLTLEMEPVMTATEYAGVRWMLVSGLQSKSKRAVLQARVTNNLKIRH